MPRSVLIPVRRRLRPATSFGFCRAFFCVLSETERRTAKDKIDEAAGKLGVDAPPVSMEAIDQAAELTKGKVGEAGAAVDDKVKAAVGPAQ